MELMTATALLMMIVVLAELYVQCPEEQRSAARQQNKSKKLKKN